MSEKPRVILVGGKEDRPEDDWRECAWWCASLHKPHRGPCFEIYSHEDTCPGAPDCVHEDDHIPANHRGDDIDTIGTFPCDCADDLLDAEREHINNVAGENLPLVWALDQIDRIFKKAGIKTK